MNTKLCKKCNITKPISEFYLKNPKTGLRRGECILCCSIYRKQNYENNKERFLEKGKKYYEKNKSKIKQYRKKFYEDNKERVIADNIEYYLKNKPKIMQRRNIKHKEKYKTDTLYKLKYCLRRRFKIALKNNAKSGSAIRDLGCSIKDLKIYLESLFESGMTWDNYGKWHIDHIIPLCNFDLLDSEQVKLACHYTNLQPLWAEDNLKKGGRINCTHP